MSQNVSIDPNTKVSCPGCGDKIEFGWICEDCKACPGCCPCPPQRAA